MGFQKGAVPWNKGIPHKESSKEKMKKWRSDRSEEVRANIILALSVPDTKRKLSENNRMRDPIVAERCAAANRGKKRSAEFCKHMSEVRTGYVTPSSQRKKQSVSMRLAVMNGNHPHVKWRGGTTSLQRILHKTSEYKIWALSVFKRDNYTCQECGRRDGRINPHHIITLSSLLVKHRITTLEEALECKELWDISNGVTLCIECHKNKHRNIKKERMVDEAF